MIKRIIQRKIAVFEKTWKYYQGISQKKNFFFALSYIWVFATYLLWNSLWNLSVSAIANFSLVAYIVLMYNVQINFQGLVQALCLTFVFTFKTEFLWPMVIKQSVLACWKCSWESKEGVVVLRAPLTGTRFPLFLYPNMFRQPVYGTFFDLISQQIIWGFFNFLWRLTLKVVSATFLLVYF